MKKVVCIGGGSGQASLLKGLKQIKDIELSTIVAMSDDGGSTGILRHDLNLPAMGDIRNVMVSLAESEDMMTTIMNYRFDNNSGYLSGHSLGNIIISALSKNSDDFMDAVVSLSKTLKVKGNIYPCTVDNVTLKAEMSNGEIISGETEIRDSHKHIARIFYDEEVKAYKEAIRVIEEADYIIVGIGSLFTSILPNLIIDEIKDALVRCKGKVIYYCNSMTEIGETDDFCLEDHIEVLEKYLDKKVIDAVIYAKDIIPEEVLANYRKENAIRVTLRDKKHKYKVFAFNLLNFDNGLIRHDADKVRDSFIEIMRKI